MTNNNNPPLVVDLDGTLLRSDVLIESGFAFIRQQPFRALAPLTWLAGGKANLKARLASEVSLDAATLPYNSSVVAFLEQEKANGRTIVLATASHQRYAEEIAAHLGLFDRVLATHGDMNLSARTKRDVLIREYGERGFDYLGNSSDDLVVWATARKALLANPELGIEAKATRLGNVAQVIRSTRTPWWKNRALSRRKLLSTYNIDIFNQGKSCNSPMMVKSRFHRTSDHWPVSCPGVRSSSNLIMVEFGW